VSQSAQANAEIMAKTAADFDQGNEGLQTMLSTLMSRLTALNGSWRGLAATAFEQTRVDYEANLKKLNTALSDTAVAIRESGAQYTTTDEAAASSVTNTGGGYSLPL
jgi:WXG100 family type VII secretion target